VSASQRRGFTASIPFLRDVPNGVPLEAFRPARRKAGFAVALGRVSPEKGFDAGLAAARRAQVSMVLAGRVFPFPAHERHFRRRIAPLLDGRRVFVGPVGLARKRRLLAAARCLVVPSAVAETSSLVAMEALASGTPVVAFRVGALPEVVEHGKTGFLVDSVEEMADAIRDAGALSPAACRREAEERFSADAMVERYLDLYDEVLDRALRAGGIGGGAPDVKSGEAGGPLAERAKTARYLDAPAAAVPALPPARLKSAFRSSSVKTSPPPKKTSLPMLNLEPPGNCCARHLFRKSSVPVVT
jgi:hypothetical protein